jgi:hypothetical protein
MYMVIVLGHKSLRFSLSSTTFHIWSHTSVETSNMQRPPYFSVEGQPALLTDHENKLIEQLLEVCGQLEDDGASTQSAWVDKIGMTWLEAFLSRNARATCSH